MSNVVLVGHISERRVALLLDAIERVLRMVAVTPLPDSPATVAGVINYRGDNLVVVAPHPRLDVPLPPVRVDHHLLVIRGKRSYALWVDQVEQVVTVDRGAFVKVQSSAGSMVAPFLVRIGDENVPLLSTEALDPGPILQDLDDAAS
jgi:chemotaxis signal transduction protein